MIRKIVTAVKGLFTEEVTDVAQNEEAEHSIYSKFFDASSIYWEKDNPEDNLLFLKSRQEYANHLLRSRGWLLLSEVYEMLDIPKTKVSRIVGWSFATNKDSFVDFGVFGKEGLSVGSSGILLDFNVDGCIFY